MEDFNEELVTWFTKLQELPPECHLLCPRLSEEDGENYKVLDDPESAISVEEKKSRIAAVEERIRITYWSSLVFGFDKQTAGHWLDEFSQKLEYCLKYCADCVLTWHMKRKPNIQVFSEYVSAGWANGWH